MNAGLEAHHASVVYYAADYPSVGLTDFPENLDETIHYQGIADDVSRYRAIARSIEGPILELCAGTGRVAIPLAIDGHRVTAVDVSRGMLDRFEANLRHQPSGVAERVKLVEQDITQLDLPRRDFALAIIAFNSLLCIADFSGQRRALRNAAQHLSPGGMLVLDVVNPLQLKIQGDPIPKPFFTRRNPHNGNTYTRFAAMGPFDEEHRQRLHGWYDEIASEGTVKRAPYSLHWRPIFRHELELMLEEAGFEPLPIEGGHREEPYTAQSPRMFVQARRR